MTQGTLDWRDGVPISAQFDDPYYSLDDGLAETRHVFLDGNDLPARLTPDFHVAELGTGTGLNLLALAACGQPARYTGFEAYPLTKSQISAALRPWAELAPLAEALISAWQADGFTAQIGPVTATIIVGDARQTLPAWDGHADAWFLDGFSPAKNPELWGPDLMTQVARHTAPGGTLATYTAAGHVRRALTAAGFTVTRCPGYGRKRHMTVGRLDP